MSGRPFPTAAEIVDCLGRGRVPTDPVRPPEPRADLLGPILELHRSNARQWGREDDARHAGDDDAVVADAKRDIDRMNRTRHGYMEAIDREISSVLPPCEDAPLATESPGMAVDRLSVLLLRIAATEARAASGAADAHVYADRLPRLRAQLDALEQAIDQLLNDLASSRRSFFRYESLKLYGAGESEPAR